MPISHIVELFALEERNFVCEAYRELLGREPDQQGMAYYLGRLSLGYSKTSIIVDLAKSKEARPINQILGLKALIDNEKRARNPLRKIFNTCWNKDRSEINSRVTELAISRGAHDITNILHSLNHNIARIAECQSANGLKNENALKSVESKTLLKEQEVRNTYLKLLGREVESCSVLESCMKLSSIDELSNIIKTSPEYVERNLRLRIPNLPRKPFVTIIIVNLNGSIHLSELFASIKKQTYDNFEVVFVDNGSADDSIAKAKEIYPNVKVVALDRNYGFAEANNIGYEVANGDLILLLNNDMAISEKFIELLVQEVLMDKDNKIGAVSPKILFFTRFVTITISSTNKFSLFREEILKNLNSGYNKIIDRSGIEIKKFQHKFLVPCSNGEIDFRLDGLTDRSEITDISVDNESLSNWTINSSPESLMLRLDLSGHTGHFVINNAGSYINSNGDAGDIGFMEDDNMQYDSARNVDAFCGGAVLIRRDALARKQLFCSDFFCVL